MEQNINSKKSKKKRIITLIITIVLNLAIVGFIAGREIINNTSGSSSLEIEGINVLFIFLGLLAFLIALFADFMKYKGMLRHVGGRHDLRGAFEVATYGKYADNVTPFGAGGQPFQMHYLHKRGYSSGASAAIPIAGFLTQQIAFILIAVVVLIINPKAFEALALIRVAAYVGLGFYSIIPLAILFFVIIPKPFAFFIKGIMKIGQFLHIVKDYEKSTEGVLKTLDEYVTIIKNMIKKPLFVLRLMFWSLLYQFAIISIPFFSILTFKGSIDWWTAFSITIYVYLAITIIPTPGNSGVAEGSFYVVFSSLNGGALFWAMIMWRALVYYSWIIIGLFVVMHSAVVNTLWTKKNVPLDRPLKIGLVCDLFYPSMDGVVRTVDQYARALQKMGHTPIVICPEAEGQENVVLSYEVFRIPKFKLLFTPFDTCQPFLNRKIKKYLKEQNFDLFHIHSPFLAGQMIERFARRNKIPTVATFHSKYYDDALHITHSKLLSRQLVSIIVNFYTKIDSVWACSRTTGETLKSYGYNGEIGVMENGVEAMPEGNPLEFKEEAIKQFNIPTDKKILLFVGQQIWHKNIKLVLDVSKELAKEDDSYITIIAGTGYDEEAIKSYAKAISIFDKVIFPGKIENRKLLFGVYQAADILFFPSLYDNAPLVVREAALSHTPALLVKGSNSAEIITDNVNGYVADNDIQDMTRKVKEIFSSGTLKEVSDKAFETIPTPWPVIVERVVERYKRELRRD